MRDVQKGRKSWLERLTSPPESDDEDGLTHDNHAFEPSLDAGPPGPRDSRVPEKFGPFAPPGLRPPPSDDLKSAPPERSGDHTGPAFDTGQNPSPFAPERLHLDPDSGHYAPERNHFDSEPGRFTLDRNHFDSKLDDPTPTPTPRPLPAPAPRTTKPREPWDSPVPSTSRSDKPSPTDSPRLPSSPSGPSSQPGKSSLSGLSSASGSGVTSPAWQSEPSVAPTKPRTAKPAPAPSFDTDPLANGAAPTPQDTPPPDFGLSDDDVLSRPSEAEQVEAARKRHVDELQHRWLVTQAQILDDPRDAVREAGLLIGDAMQFVTSTFTDHRDRIEREWRHNDSMSTDELRTVMRRYRNLFQYVLSASQLPDI